MSSCSVILSELPSLKPLFCDKKWVPQRARLIFLLRNGVGIENVTLSRIALRYYRDSVTVILTAPSLVTYVMSCAVTEQIVKQSRRFRAEKRNEHAWTFLPRSPGRVWKNGGTSNIFLRKNKMFPLTTWKEQAICLQKLQAVVITFSLLNFLDEYHIVKRTLTTLISLRCTGNVHA